MAECGWCNLTEEDQKYLLAESEYWRIFLADEQDYVGRCILVLRRHCGSLAKLSENEWIDLRNQIEKIEGCLKTIFGAEVCNWSCLMNSFFKDPAPRPHVHIHVRPRYRNPVTINGNTYIDHAFGHHYALDVHDDMSAEDRRTVFQSMQNWLNP